MLPKPCKDHKGQYYQSVTEMCDHYNISRKKYYKRRSAGHSIEAALTGKGIKKNVKHCKDHLGHYFVSEKEMCRAYNVSNVTFRERIRRGWPLKKALTQNPKSFNKPQRNVIGDDHVGIKRLMKCGLNATIIEYKNHNHVVIEFEDGERKTCTLQNFNHAFVGHPYLRASGKSTYGCLEVRCAFSSSQTQDVFYETLCKVCGKKDIMSARQLVEHNKMHNDTRK